MREMNTLHFANDLVRRDIDPSHRISILYIYSVSLAVSFSFHDVRWSFGVVLLCNSVRTNLRCIQQRYPWLHESGNVFPVVNLNNICPAYGRRAFILSLHSNTNGSQLVGGHAGVREASPFILSGRLQTRPSMHTPSAPKAHILTS